MKNILVATDFNAGSKKLFEAACRLAEKFGSKIWVIHIAAPDPDFVGYDVGPQYIRTTRAEDLKKEHKMLQQMAEDIEAKGITAESLLVQGPTVKMILEEMEKLKIDLIVLGHVEHAFLYNAFFGSTAKEILKKSKIPLLVIPLE